MLKYSEEKNINAREISTSRKKRKETSKNTTKPQNLFSLSLRNVIVNFYSATNIYRWVSGNQIC